MVPLQSERTLLDFPENGLMEILVTEAMNSPASLANLANIGRFGKAATLTTALIKSVLP